MLELAGAWRKEARRFRKCQEEECAIGDDEWFLCKTDADRLEQCANELTAIALTHRPQERDPA